MAKSHRTALKFKLLQTQRFIASSIRKMTDFDI